MANEHLRNLPVPFFSQRQNDYIWEERFISHEAAADNAVKNLYDTVENGLKISMDCRSCNITGVMMIMKYLGLTGVERTVGDKTFTTPKTPLVRLGGNSA